MASVIVLGFNGVSFTAYSILKGAGALNGRHLRAAVAKALFGSVQYQNRYCNARSLRQGGVWITAKTIVLTLALYFVAATVCFGGDLQISTWKLNEAKSKLAPGVAKNHTVVYEAAGEDMKVTVDGTDPDDKPVHHEWTGKFDGKDYPVTGDPASDARSYKQVNARTLALTIKKDGKVAVTGRIVVSADGKTRTVTTSGTDPKGKKFKSIAVYDKQ